MEVFWTESAVYLLPVVAALGVPYSVLGRHSRANRWAKARFAGVRREATSSRRRCTTWRTSFSEAVNREAARFNHRYA